jgi:hypothetical protein
MTLEGTVRRLLALRDRLPERGPGIDAAQAVLDELARTDSREAQADLVGRALSVLRGIPAVRGEVQAIAHDFSPPERPRPPSPARRGRPPPPRAAPPPDGVGMTRAPDPGEGAWKGVGRRRGARVGASPRPAEAAQPPHAEAVGPPETVERTPHLDVEPQGPVAVGATVTVSAYVDTQALREGEHGDVLELPALDELRLGVTLTSSSHFALHGDPHGEVVVKSAEERSTEATFELECVSAADGTPGVAASFTYEWRPAGTVWRELEVEGVDATPGAPEEREPPLVAVDPAAGPADLVVTVIEGPERDGRHFTLEIASPHLDPYRRGVTVPWVLPSRTGEYVAGFMSAFTTSDPGGRVAALKGAGQELFLATPPEFQEAFWALVDADTPLETIQVVTGEPFIPWELMIPNDGTRDDLPPLGVEYAVGRWVHPRLACPQQAMPIVDSWVIAPCYRGEKKLEFSKQEAELVMAAFNGEAIEPAFIQEIDARFRARAPTLIHMICHGVDDANGQILDLDPDERLREIQLAGLDGVRSAVREKHPFVFINACQVGRPTPSLLGTGGFASRFTQLGARCVIAPIWSVKDSVAGEVARAFYERISADPNVPFAQVLRDIRKLAYEGDDPEDSYAAYCFYGDPRAARAAA